MHRTLHVSWLCLLMAVAGPVGAVLTPGSAAPALQAPLLGGTTSLDLASLRGKVVYVDFWATWCAPCRVSLPLLDGLHKQLAAQGFAILGVNVEQDTAAVQRTVQQLALSYPVLHPVADAVMLRWQVRAMPSSLLIDRQGRVRQVYEGFRSAEFPALRKDIETLLQEQLP